MSLVVEIIFVVVAIYRLKLYLACTRTVQVDNFEFENADQPGAFARTPCELRGVFYGCKQRFLNAVGNVVVVIDTAARKSIERVAVVFE